MDTHARDDLADWEARTDALLADLEAERSPNPAALVDERYPPHIATNGD